MTAAPDLNVLLTDATLLFAALKLVPALVLLAWKGAAGALDSRAGVALYALSKASGVLAVAFALAAAASAGKAGEVAGLAVLLVVATALTVWSVYARVAGTFRGLAGMRRPRG